MEQVLDLLETPALAFRNEKIGEYQAKKAYPAKQESELEANGIDHVWQGEADDKIGNDASAACCSLSHVAETQRNHFRHDDIGKGTISNSEATGEHD